MGFGGNSITAAMGHDLLQAKIGETLGFDLWKEDLRQAIGGVTTLNQGCGDAASMARDFTVHISFSH